MADTDGGARFEACLAQVLALEGGYADNPADPGGATNFGITRRTLAAWRHVVPWTALDKAAVRDLTRAEAADIYRAMYWTPCAGDGLPAGLDLAVFDYGVHSGPDRAVRALQAALGVGVDGIAGPVTLGAARTAARQGRVPALIEALCRERLGFLQRLATFATFGRGWSSRVATIRAAALAMASDGTSPSTNPRSLPMNILSGYRTYIVAALMALTGLAQLLGIDVPALDGQSAGHLLMEALAVIFLRRGIQSATGK